jgi:radical SAM superfamily enzyme YgiQ (UPF0313 family)
MNNPRLKILLVKPYANVVNYSQDVPLGILYLSAYLKKYYGDKIDIRFVNMRLLKNKKAEFMQILMEMKPDVVGISTLSFESEFLKDYTRLVRATLPGTFVVIGGPYSTIAYEEALRTYDIDAAVVGEGENVLKNIVQAITDGADPGVLKGVATLRNGNVQFGGREAYIENLDDVPFPDYGILNIEDYWGYHPQMNFVLADLRYVPIISSRACPYGCAYCHNVFGKKLRVRSPDNFVDEVEMLYRKYGVREYHIVDDIFNIDRKRMHEILEMILARDLRIRIAFPNAIRGDLLEREDIDMLKRAGTYMMTFAIESGSDRIQNIIHKNLNIGKVINNIEYASGLGLLTKGYFMLGFPDETIDELKMTVDVAVSSKLDMAAFFVVTPFRGTELYDMAKQRYGERVEGYSNYYEKSMYEVATGFNMKKFQKKAYMKFYSPRRVLNIYKKVPLKKYFLYRLLAGSLSTLMS